MWNTDFVLPSLLVLAILLIYFFVLPRLPNRINRAFMILIGNPGLLLLFELDNGIVFSTIYGGSVCFAGTISIQIIQILLPF